MKHRYKLLKIELDVVQIQMRLEKTVNFKTITVNTDVLKLRVCRTRRVGELFCQSTPRK